MRRVWLGLLCACGAAAPQQVEIAPPPQGSAPEVVHVTPKPVLFPEDPTLDAFAPNLHTTFTQESWIGATEWQQHCREWGIKSARKDEVVRAANALLASRGIASKLPETTRDKKIVLSIGQYSSGLFPTGEALVKFVVCTEGVAPRSLHEDFDVHLQETKLAPDFPFGAPDLSWRRVYSDGRLEIGLRWSAMDDARVAAALTPRGYVVDPAKNTVRMVPGRLLRADLRGAELWWSAAVLP